MPQPISLSVIIGGIEDAWYAYRDAAIEELARSRCEENEIPIKDEET